MRELGFMIMPIRQRRIFFDQAYTRYHKAVYANIRKIVEDESAAEDLFQEVFLCFWEKLSEEDVINSVDSWLFVVSHNKAISYLKKKISESLMIFSEDFTESTVELKEEVEDFEFREEQIRIINEAVSYLSSRKKQVFMLNKYEGKSIEQIASMLNLTPQSVREYLKQSIRFIRQYVFKKKSVKSLPALIFSLVSLSSYL